MVSRRKLDPTDRNFKKHILVDLRSHFTDYYYGALHTKSQFKREVEDPIDVANKILSEEYNFIGITERLEESAVVLMMLMNLKMSDILYLSAKGKGGYDDAGGDTGGCTYIWPSFVSPGMQDVFDSEEWQSMIQYDMALYQAVNASLDLTIDSLGRETFVEKLATFRHAQKVAEQKCQHDVVIPCDEGGQFHSQTDCLWNDSGCGYKCLDEVAETLGLS